MYALQVGVAIILVILSGQIYSFPLQNDENEGTNSHFETNHLDGIENSKLPKKYKDIALMCDYYRNFIALAAGLDSESLSKQVDITSESDSDDSNDLQDAGRNDKTALYENVVAMLNEPPSDDKEYGSVKLPNDEEAVRKERVRRNMSNGIPQDLLQMLQGVCVTDECLQVVREYFEWRRQNGYPVYTGVSQLG